MPHLIPMEEVSSRSFMKDIGFKFKVSHSDALMILNYWKASEAPLSASMSQMCRLYAFLLESVADGEINIKTRTSIMLIHIYSITPSKVW